MKKKIYDKPTMEAVKIKATQQLLAGSVKTIDGNAGIGLGGGGTGPVLSRDIDLGMDFLLDFDQLE